MSKKKNWIDESVQKWNLDSEEREILEAYDRRDWKPLPKKEFETEKRRFQAAIRYTRGQRKKSQSISIRVNPNDLEVFKARAANEGLPYQTLISSLVHKYGHRKKIA